MASGGSSEQQSGPWEGQKPFLTDVFQNAQNLYGQGTPDYYPGATYVGFNPIQDQSMDRALHRSQNNVAADKLGAWATGAMGNTQLPNMTDAMQAANYNARGALAGQDNLKRHAGGDHSLADSMKLYKQASSPWENRMLKASGNQMGFGSAASQVGADDSGGQAMLQQFGADGPNPYLDDMYDSASRKLTEQYQDVVNPALNATFGSAGRTGSSLHQENAVDASGEYMDSLASLGANIYGNAYEGDAGRRLSAGSTLLSDDATRKGISSNLYLGDRGLAQDMLGQGYSNAIRRTDGATNMFNAGRNRSLDAARSLTDSSLAGANTSNNMFGTMGDYRRGAASMIPTFNDMKWSDIDRMRGVGDDVQGLSREMLQDDMNRFNYYQQAPWNLLQQYANLVGGTNSINVSEGDSSNWGISF